MDDQLHLEDAYTEQVDNEEETSVGPTSVLPAAGSIQIQSGPPGDSDNTTPGPSRPSCDDPTPEPSSRLGLDGPAWGGIITTGS